MIVFLYGDGYRVDTNFLRYVLGSLNGSDSFGSGMVDTFFAVVLDSLNVSGSVLVLSTRVGFILFSFGAVWVH